MPIYEYACPDCQEEFEQLVRSAEAAATTECPSCGSRRVERRMSVVAAPRAAEKPPLPMGGPGGGCGRCGDPEGPCGL